MKTVIGSGLSAVAPAKAGAQFRDRRGSERHWIPVFASRNRDDGVVLAAAAPMALNVRFAHLSLRRDRLSIAARLRRLLSDGDEKNWIPAFAGMTASSPIAARLRRLLSDAAVTFPRRAGAR
jgi:hypothetical protein